MNKYIIYCTPEQTREALKLGACLEEIAYPEQNEEFIQTDNYRLYRIPTAEEMIGWLEERGFIVEVSFRGTDEPNKQGNKIFIYHLFDYSEWEELNPLSNMYKSRQEATLAAIDAALEYLINNKK